MEQQTLVHAIDLQSGYVSLLVPINVFINGSVNKIVIPPEVVKKISEAIENAIMNMEENESNTIH